MRSVQQIRYGLGVGASKSDVLGFVDDLNIIGDNKETVVKFIIVWKSIILIDTAKTVGLVVSEEKTKLLNQNAKNWWSYHQE